MARKLASVVALIAMAVSATALALGLGDIQTRSALNQPFEADVELLSVDPAELDAVRVRLASAEAFQRAGVDRPFFLSDLKFTPQLDAAGKPVIHIRSERPIREPFLNFLVEVNWPKGRLVREYTVLLDPPTTLARQPAPVARPRAAAPAPAVRSAEPAARVQPRAVMPDEYGPVQDSETLWSIARKLRPDGASLAQTLMALYKANPNAFVQGDINRLQKGRILRVPDRAEVMALSRREAEAAYRAEQSASLASRTQPPASAAEPAPAAAETSPAGEAAAPGAEPQSDSGELRIATPRPEGSGEAGSGDDAGTQATAKDIDEALLLAREDAETARQSADNLRGEVQELRQQLEDMQRVISLQNDQLARLQANVAEGEATAPVVPPAGPIDEVAGPETDRPVEPVVPPAGPIEEVAGPETDRPVEPVVPPAGPIDEVAGPETERPVEPVVPPAGPIDEVAGPEAAAPLEPTDEATMPEPDAAGAVAPDADAETTPVAAEPRRRPDLMQRLIDNATLIAGAAAAILVLLILLALARRRKQEPEPEKQAAPAPEDDGDESILLEPSEGQDLDLGPEDAAPAGNDTSFLSEFSPSEMHSLADETSEVDPVSEADVYIAYGRYDQAEELLGQALSREPGRMALKFKLLEVYYANRNVGAFTACAQELADAGQDGVDTAAWQRVCDMGRDLAPEYPLFAASAAPAASDSLPDFEPSQPVAIEPLSEFSQESVLDIPGLDEQAGTPASEPAEPEQPAADSTSRPGAEGDMDLTLDLDDLSMPHSVAQDEDTIEGLESIDLELPDLDKDPAREAARSEVDDDSLILDLDTGLEDSVAEQPPRAEPEALDEGLDAESLQAQLEELSDLTELDSELSQLTADFDALTEPAQGEFEAQPAAEQPQDQGMDLDIPAPFAEQMADEDEVQTKLDLAIAYMEMGDKDGARSILDEVRAEGSDTQKAEAEKLLSDIGG